MALAVEEAVGEAGVDEVEVEHVAVGEARRPADRDLPDPDVPQCSQGYERARAALWRHQCIAYHGMAIPGGLNQPEWHAIPNESLICFLLGINPTICISTQPYGLRGPWPPVHSYRWLDCIVRSTLGVLQLQTCGRPAAYAARIRTSEVSSLMLRVLCTCIYDIDC